MENLLEPDPQVRAVFEELQADPDEALRRGQALLKAAQQSGDKALLAHANRALSGVLLQQGEWFAALQPAEDALVALTSLGDTVGQVSALRAVVEVRLAEGSFADARQAVDEHLQEFRKAQDANGEALSLVLQADISAREGLGDPGFSHASEAADIFRNIGDADRGTAVALSLLRLAEFYTESSKSVEALKVAEDALEIFKTTGGEQGQFGAGVALHAAAKANLAGERFELALSRADDALSIFQRVDNSLAAQELVLRTKIDVLMAEDKKPQARSTAKEAVTMFRVASNAKREASAQLLVAEVCLQTLQYGEAVAAAKRALALYRQLASQAGQLAAFSAIVAADFDNAMGEAIPAAQEFLAFVAGKGDSFQEAEAHLTLANVYVAALGKKIARCSLVSPDDSIAALQAAKQAHRLSLLTRHSDGMENAMRVVASVLMYNQVPADLIAAASTPEKVLEDVMNGRFSNPKNALPQTPLPTNVKLETVVPTSKQLERTKFGWTNPLKGYSYTLIWQSTKDREVQPRKPRKTYDILGVNMGSKTCAAPALVQARSNPASERDDPLVVCTLSPDAKTSYGAAMITLMHTISAMVSAKMSRITFVCLDETYFEWTETTASECSLYNVVLGIARSCRLEAPFLSVGFVGGDIASWKSNPAPMIESIFDVVETDESEVMFKNGDSFSPLLIKKDLDETMPFVKAKKKANWVTAAGAASVGTK